MDAYQIRFVGRFVFAYTGRDATATSVAAIAVDMTQNLDLAIGPHRTLMAVQRTHVHTLGTLPPALSLFQTSPLDVDAEDQLLVWDLGGYDVRPVTDGGHSVTLESWGDIPDIKKHGGSNFDTSLLARTPGRSIVGSRVVVQGGTLTAVQLDPDKRVSLEPLGQDGPQQYPTLPLPDVVTLDLEIDGPLRLRMTPFAGPCGASIVVTPAGAAQLEPQVITISHLCPRGGSTFDREFAAYYDVLQAPKPTRDRLVPYTAEVHEGRHADCTGLATLPY